MDRERVFCLADLCAILLKNVKPILITLLVFALIGGAIGAGREIRTGSVSPVTEEDIAAAAEAVKAAESEVQSCENTLDYHFNHAIPETRALINNILDSNRSIRNYISNSVYNSMDPYRCGVARILFHLDSDAAIGLDLSRKVSSSFDETDFYSVNATILPFSDDVIRYTGTILGLDIEEQYIQELISLFDYDDGTIELSVVSDDLKMAEEAVDYLYKELENELKSIDKSVSFEIISKYVGFEINQDMISSQDAVNSALIHGEQEISELNTKLNDLFSSTEKKEENLQTAKTKLRSAQNNLSEVQTLYQRNSADFRAIIKNAIKFFILFAIIGFVLSCIVCIVFGLFSKTLQNRSDIINRYSFPLIGVIPRKKPYIFEKLICRLEGDGYMDYESGASITAQTLKTIVGNKKTGLIYSSDSESAKQISDRLISQAEICGNILEDASALKSLDKFESIVLVEKRGLSKISKIDDEALLLKSMGKVIAGIILT